MRTNKGDSLSLKILHSWAWQLWARWARNWSCLGKCNFDHGQAALQAGAGPLSLAIALAACCLPQLILPKITLWDNHYHLSFTGEKRELSGSWDDNYKFQDLKKSLGLSLQRTSKVSEDAFWSFNPPRVFHKEMLTLSLNPFITFIWEGENTSHCF